MKEATSGAVFLSTGAQRATKALFMHIFFEVAYLCFV
jgi:hypothetical protein